MFTLTPQAREYIKKNGSVITVYMKFLTDICGG